MKNRNIDPIPVFLDCPEGKSMLAGMIQQKKRVVKDLSTRTKQLLSSDIYPDVNPDIRPYFLEKIAEMRFGQELAQVKRELRNMTYLFNKSSGKIEQNKKWEQAYRYATEDVQIGEVVNQFLGIREFRRNIRCPFHDEKTPSLKVYTNRNFFVCFGCGARGSPVDFVMQYKNCSFREAVELLSNF